MRCRESWRLSRRRGSANDAGQAHPKPPLHRLIERLPPVRGRLTENAPLAQLTWFRVGGPAEVMFRPADVEDLAQFLAHKPKDVKVTVIGVASNLLIRDGGVKGVVVRLGRGFVEIEAEGEEISAGAGALDLNVALSACAAGISGLEFLSGIPGTIGGGLRMNAGAYGAEFKDVLVSAIGARRQGPAARHDPGRNGPLLPPLRRGRGLGVRLRPLQRQARRAQGHRRAHGRRSRRSARKASRSAPAPAAPPSPTRREGARPGS